MSLVDKIKAVEAVAAKHSPAILAAIATTGTISTAYLAARGAYKASQHVEAVESHRISNPTDKPVVMDRKEIAKETWRFYIPAVASGIGTIGAIITSTHISSRRTAAITAAYTLTEKAFVEYRDKVTKVMGDTAESKVRDAVAQEKVASNPPPAELVITTPGDVLCCEGYTGRYFLSSQEELKRAENKINKDVLAYDVAHLCDLYLELGLPQTQYSGRMGWTSEDGLLDLKFSSMITDDGRPCVVFDYNYVNPV